MLWMQWGKGHVKGRHPWLLIQSFCIAVSTCIASTYCSAWPFRQSNLYLYIYCFLTHSTIISRVTKGVRDLPGNFQSATSTIPSGKALMYFGLFLASGVFFVFIAFTLFLPVIVLVPQKFALCFTFGCAFIIGSFFALRGPKNQFSHMTSKEVQNHSRHIPVHFLWS